MNASDITGRYSGGWVIDFGADMPLEVAARFEAPFRHIETRVKPERLKNREDRQRTLWWIHKRPRPDMRAALHCLPRFVATPRVAKHRLFAFLSHPTLADSRLFVFALTGDAEYGVLHSSIHELWSLRMGARHGDGDEGGRPTYNTTTCFETFPLPWPPGTEPASPGAEGYDLHAAIAAAVKELNELRERWLNPPELIDPIAATVDREDDFADVPAEARPLVRQSAIMARAAAHPQLKKRTLTNLYNQRPTWLKLAHEKLDRAVLSAYAAIDPAGQWSPDWAAAWTDTGAGQPLPADHALYAKRAEVDQRVLANLLRLNQDRAKHKLCDQATTVQ